MIILEHHKIWNSFYPEDPILPGDGNVIHHINGNHFDNRIENLQKMTKSDHSKLHNTPESHPRGYLGKHHTKETKKKMSEIKYKKPSKGFKNKKHTEETKKRMSEYKKKYWKERRILKLFLSLYFLSSFPSFSVLFSRCIFDSIL
jgi:hypothetical protein